MNAPFLDYMSTEIDRLTKEVCKVDLTEEELEGIAIVSELFEKACEKYMNKEFENLEDLYKWLSKEREEKGYPFSDKEKIFISQAIEQTDAYITDLEEKAHG